MPSLLLVLLLLSSADGRGPSEFLRSFLTRPQLLPNAKTASGPHDRPGSNVLCLDLAVDNWSPYMLARPDDADSLAGALLDQAFPYRDLPAKSRDFALRARSGLRRSGDRMEDVAAWKLTDHEGMQVSQLSVAWRIGGGGGDQQQFAVALGDFSPKLGEMFRNRSGGGLECMGGSGVERRLTVADLRTTVAAEMEKVGDLHYRIRVSVVPQNMDIWFWQKYKDEMPSAKPNSRSKKKALPKVTQHQKKRTSQQGRNVKEEEEGLPLYDRTELLREGRTLTDLHDKGVASLRDALRDQAKSHSVAVGIHLENWTRFKLGTPTVAINSGKLLDGGELLAPREVLPGRQDVAAVGNTGNLRGTSGVMHWPVGSEVGGAVLHVMWSIPYSMQFWSAWSGVGLTSGGGSAPSYSQMYSKKDPRRYVRVKAGRGYEFSDGALIAMAFMDGGSSSKPVLRVRLIPIDNLDLAALVRRRLGMPVSRADDVAGRGTGEEEEGDSPQVGRVVTESNGASAPTAWPPRWLFFLLLGEAFKLRRVMSC